MRATLKYFLARLGLVSFATLGLSATLTAHDMPAARALPAASGAAAQPIQRIAVERPDAGHAPRPNLAQSQSQSQAEPRPSIVVARPSVGSAPRPAVKVAQSAAPSEHKPSASKGARAGEVYMPYDFQVSDWRFGQFPYYAATATAPSPQQLPSLAHASAAVPQLPETELTEKTASQAIPSSASTFQAEMKFGPPSPQSAALGVLLQRLDEWQCTAYGLVSDSGALARAADRSLQLWKQLALNYRQFHLSPAATASTQQVAVAKQPTAPAGPQFVVYNSALGGHIVLTVEQARQWQFAAPAAQSSVRAALGAAFKPIQSSALASASRQLEFAGRGLLSLSQSLSSIAGGTQAEAKVASLPSRND